MQQHFSHILLAVLFLLSAIPLQGQYTIQEIPDPKTKGQNHFVSNPDGIISPSTVTTLDAISTSIEAESGSEYAIVIVDDYDGYDDFEFALELFNTWGIGKAGVDNGLLLFVSVKRHEYRFISGRGMEGLYPDAYLYRTGENYLVPNFRKDDYDTGLIEASEFIAQVLTAPSSVAELQRLMPELSPYWRWGNPTLQKSLAIFLVTILMVLYLKIKTSGLHQDLKSLGKGTVAASIFPSFFLLPLLMLVLWIALLIIGKDAKFFDSYSLHYYVFILCAFFIVFLTSNYYDKLKRSIKDEGEKQAAASTYFNATLLPLLLSGFGVFMLKYLYRRREEIRDRLVPPDFTGNWERINRNEKDINRLLDAGQQKEEKLDSVKYEVWKNTVTGEVKYVAWDNKSMRFHTCPNCSYRTLVKNESEILERATYTHAGKKEFYNDCRYCDYYKRIKVSVIPKKVRSSSSSSSSGGYSSSRSSGGSWGGGSSGGGGAGGRW